ncbi:MAG: hypothetical protein Q8N88_02635 [Nanoarchaeota archaeon]|nr:hypothetical protein [Nanoarchaeota archaeon]
MVTQIEAYKCDICGLQKIWSRQKAEEHERTLVVKPMPIGFCHGNQINAHKGGTEITCEIVIDDQGRICDDHNFIQQTIFFIYDTDGKFKEMREKTMYASRHSRRYSIFEKGEVFQRFKKSYDTPENQAIEIPSVFLLKIYLTNFNLFSNQIYNINFFLTFQGFII